MSLATKPAAIDTPRLTSSPNAKRTWLASVQFPPRGHQRITRLLTTNCSASMARAATATPIFALRPGRTRLNPSPRRCHH